MYNVLGGAIRQLSSSIRLLLSFTFFFHPLKHTAWDSWSAHYSHWLTAVRVTAFCSFTRNTSTHKIVHFNTRNYHCIVCFFIPIKFRLTRYRQLPQQASFGKTMANKNLDTDKGKAGRQHHTYLLCQRLYLW